MPKKIAFLLIIILSQGCISTQDYPSRTSIWLDENGKEISKKDFNKKWGKDDGYARWDTLKDNKRIATFSTPVYETLEGSYDGFHKILENLSNNKYSNNTIFLVEYVFKDDFCSSKYSNNWSKSTIIERKDFLDSYKIEIEKKYDNIAIIYLFQEGISYANTGKNSYFFTDKKNIILNELFKEPAMCGSYAIINPDGNILIRNGEYRLDWMAEFINPTVWGKIFYTENNS